MPGGDDYDDNDNLDYDDYDYNDDYKYNDSDDDDDKELCYRCVSFMPGGTQARLTFITLPQTPMCSMIIIVIMIR